MGSLEFGQLLSGHMRRIRASASGVATELGMSRESVNNWRQGLALPHRRHRDRLLHCAAYLRLTEDETNALLAAAGFETEFPHAQAQSHAPYSDYLDSLFARLARLSPYSILMLLSQAHWGQPPFREQLLAQARSRFGEDRVLHIQPPYSVDADPGRWFAAIGAQCGFDTVTCDFEFESALQSRLAGGERLFCMVSRFEQGPAAPREMLAGILRSLSEMHSGRLHLMLCGGEALARLRYEGGDLSLLNIAAVEHWPDPDGLTVHALASTWLGEAPDAPRVERALRVAGGHPVLLEDALQLLQREPAIDEDALVGRLADSPRIWQAILPQTRDPQRAAHLRRMAQQEQLARAQPWLQDALLRALYWGNLVRTREQGDGSMLVWRCEAIRLAVLRALDAGEETAP